MRLLVLLNWLRTARSAFDSFNRFAHGLLYQTNRNYCKTSFGCLYFSTRYLSRQTIHCELLLCIYVYQFHQFYDNKARISYAITKNKNSCQDNVSTPPKCQILCAFDSSHSQRTVASFPFRYTMKDCVLARVSSSSCPFEYCFERNSALTHLLLLSFVTRVVSRLIILLRQP